MSHKVEVGPPHGEPDGKPEDTGGDGSGGSFRFGEAVNYSDDDFAENDDGEPFDH